jgi:FtsZ-binding cell division protein ZapB
MKTHLSKQKVCEPLYSNVDRAALLEALKTSDGKEACKTLTVVQTEVVPFEEIGDLKEFTMNLQHEHVKLQHENVALKKENADLASRLQAYQANGGSGGSVTNNNITNITHIHLPEFSRQVFHEYMDKVTGDDDDEVRADVDARDVAQV